MSVELFLNEVLTNQEDRDLLLADPKILEEGERIANYVKTGQMVITEMAPGVLPLAVLAHLTRFAVGYKLVGVQGHIEVQIVIDHNLEGFAFYAVTLIFVNGLAAQVAFGTETIAVNAAMLF